MSIKPLLFHAYLIAIALHSCNKESNNREVLVKVKDHNKITSGRKNFLQHHTRITNTLKIVKKYFNHKE